MKVVEINILNSKFKIACDEGQESSLVEISQKFNDKAKEISKSYSSAQDSLVIVMAALMQQDELLNGQNDFNQNIEQSIVQIFDSVTEKVEAISEKI